MKLRTTVQATLLAFSSIAISAPTAGQNASIERRNPATEMYLPNPAHLNEERIDRNYAGKKLTPLNDARRTRSLHEIVGDLPRIRSDMQPVQTLSIRPMFLAMPTAEEVDFTVTSSGTGVPRQYAHLSLEIEGVEYVLWVVHVAEDRRPQYRHITAAVLNHSHSNAVFTVTDSGKIAGTVSTPDRAYRILQGTGPEQIVYRVSRGADQTPTRFRAALPNDLKTDIQRLENRHLQALKIAELQPSFVSVSEDSRMLDIKGGELGSLDPLRASPGGVRQVISNLTPLSSASEYEFAIVQRNRHGLRFVQTINGIRVRSHNEIRVKPDLQIDVIRISVIDPARAPAGTPIAESEAMAHAAKAYASKMGEQNRDVEFLNPPELAYEVRPRQYALELTYRFVVRFPDKPTLVAKVNALTGEVSLESDQLAATYGRKIYTTTSGAPIRGDDPGAHLVLREDPPGSFEIVDWNHMWDPEIGIFLGVDAFSLWSRIALETNQDTEPSLCCDQLGTDGNVLEYIIKTPGAETPYAEYNPNTKTILFRPVSDPDGYVPARNFDTVLHETFHHWMHVYGPDLGNEDFARVMKEGLADAFVGAFAEHYRPSDSCVNPGDDFDPLQFGCKWIIADGAGGVPGGIRNATASRQLSWIDFALAATWNENRFHDASLAVSNFFYRLHGKGGITGKKLMQLVMRTAYWLVDWEPEGLDINDFYEALIKAAEDDPSIQSKMNQVWTEMGGTVPDWSGGGGPGGPGGAPVPAAPIAVNGHPLGCDYGVAFHRVSWSTAPFAAHYRFWINSTSWNFPGHTTSTDAWTRIEGPVARAQACNGSGCSGLSSASYTLTYAAVCGSGW